jgi:hypothetical protein
MVGSVNDFNVLPFSYLVTPAQLSSGASIVSTLSFQADSKFEWHWCFASTDQDGDTDIMPNNFSVLITDNSTGNKMSNARVPQRILCGPANGGFRRMARPILFAPLSTLEFDFLNLSGTNLNIVLELGGYKVKLT